MSNAALRISDEVKEALANGTPVVALESTIFTHGLPRPRNVEVATRGEEIIREAGGVPATIGVVHGQPVVGLSADEIKELAYDDDVTKASVRDLSYCAVSKKNAGTTIAATGLLARAAGIDVFSTGGLGGVHHGAAQSFDESADIYSLAETPIVLVSSGAKAILDISATLERFESLSIPVVGYRTDRYPGFYVVDSGHDLTARVEKPEDVAAMVETQKALGITSAILVANPVPADEQLDPQELEAVLAKAWEAAEQQGIHGQASTPFLLDFIRQATQGRSLDANVALYYNNIRVGVSIAAALVGR
ncbi:pseudouridine-5'-phosphate glycosidase [Tessaracoccus bendigoensis DSM 12906]|uniref:Pseudouridine-5'-phosphate glycosidase n=1 Tax=Tessaracoccus bendigoensis DSM 12906 TaxID=1123357 RepID=A0A1M6JTC1_9ACTN|nr:pseudouridine-5'-phosphate glycosidase [Tessaracoccus bendigoensis]SHJ49872.1 pseudouridine-5'-phosphate glycosidase [Tessaracoccus bendigoensis DSM 12906]